MDAGGGGLSQGLKDHCGKKPGKRITKNMHMTMTRLGPFRTTGVLPSHFLTLATFGSDSSARQEGGKKEEEVKEEKRAEGEPTVRPLKCEVVESTCTPLEVGR